jgi:putative ABC transport system ATP-binding protein
MIVICGQPPMGFGLTHTAYRERKARVTGTPVLRAERLKKTYKVDGNDVHALVEASLSVEPGEMVALRGRSGSGKSTLLTLVGLLARPDQGALRIVGQDALSLDRQRAADVRATHIGFVFHRPT